MKADIEHRAPRRLASSQYRFFLNGGPSGNAPLDMRAISQSEAPPALFDILISARHRPTVAVRRRDPSQPLSLQQPIRLDRRDPTVARVSELSESPLGASLHRDLDRLHDILRLLPTRANHERHPARRLRRDLHLDRRRGLLCDLTRKIVLVVHQKNFRHVRLIQILPGDGDHVTNLPTEWL